MQESMTDVLMSLGEYERLTFYRDEKLPETISIRYELWPQQGHHVYRQELAVRRADVDNARLLLTEKARMLVDRCRQANTSS